MGEVAAEATSVAVSYQVLFNAAVGLLLVLFGWVLRTIWDSISELRESHREQLQQNNQFREDIATVRELVAGKYTTREELTNGIGRLEKKLDILFAELKSKQDKT